MSRNGSGTYSLPAGNPVVTGTTISSTWANNTLTDIANALTGSLSADGQTTASGNLNMGTNRIVNLDDPQNAQDAATKYYVDQLIAALGTMAYQNASAVAITGGTVTSVSIDLRSMTNEVYLPVGPTSLRTASPIPGLMRFNTDAGGFYEGYIGSTWQKFVTVNQGSYTITYVVVGGGGGGGGGQGGGGGGGAGKYTASTLTAIPANVFTMTIGAGGAYAGTAGSTSSITGIASSSGGVGGATAPDQNFGGAGGGSGNSLSGGSGAAASGGGGNGGGGGGSVSAGASANGSSAGSGGTGSESLITGVSTYYSGGGGGAGQSPGGGGSGVGGSGASPGTAGTAGTINTGGGGGGGTNAAGGNGGSGVVILSMPTANYTGTHTGSPTVTTTGSNTVLKYTSSGTYTA